MMDQRAIAARILDLVRARGQDRTICPSEVARALADDWRPLLVAVRAVAVELARSGQVRVTQRGRPVDPQTAKGPIRLGLPKA
ncbi:MAG: DUF3253 domain-containing protein [Geminicoccaceae bacterium]|nr:MAG: DUF3253 domain-containing protein [Geminicoccaceae bacterium]